MYRKLNKSRVLLGCALAIETSVALLVLVTHFSDTPSLTVSLLLIALTLGMMCLSVWAFWLSSRRYLLIDAAIAFALVPLIHICAAAAQPNEALFAVSCALVSVYATAIFAWRNA